MAPEQEFGLWNGQPKKGAGQASNFFPHRGPRNPPNPNLFSSRPATGFLPNVSISHLSSSPSTTSPTANTGQTHNWRAPDSKALENQVHSLQKALTEAIIKGAAAENRATAYLQEKDNAERQLRDHSITEAALSTTNQQLTTENQNLKETLQKLEHHTKNCENGTNKAQKEAQNAMRHADHRINSQKGQLRTAERRYAVAAQELKQWKEKYGSLEKIAKRKAALEKRLSEWQSKAEKAQNEITALQGQQRCTIEIEESQNSMTVEQDQSSKIKNTKPPSTITQTEQPPTNPSKPSPNQTLQKAPAAEATGAKYKHERDTLYRMLKEVIARNRKVAEALEEWDGALEQDGDGEGS